MDQSVKMDTLPDRHLINNEMIDDTVRQIVKDLDLSGFPAVQPDEHQTPFEQIYNALMPVVDHLLTQNIAVLPQVLYQVDLGEQKVKGIMESENPASQLTVSIIRRCFQKVVLRRLYSTGS